LPPFEKFVSINMSWIGEKRLGKEGRTRRRGEACVVAWKRRRRMKASLDFIVEDC
jgi:hypothetical protein